MFNERLTIEGPRSRRPIADGELSHTLPHAWLSVLSGSASGAMRETAMPTVIVHHDIKDTEHWLASPKREETFGPLGVTNIRTFVDPQNPTHVALLMDIADMAVVQAFMQTPAAAAAMEHDGVKPETMVFLIAS
jgi:hypothetical protein